MIKGLRICLKSSELAEHMRERANYHEERAKVKEEELPAIQESFEKFKALRPATKVSHMNKSGLSNYDFNPEENIENLENDIRNHRNKALAYRYMADHLFTEDYDLDENDLRRLEILK